MSTKFNELVRDNVPDMIKKEGKNPVIEVLDDNKYKDELDKKLLDEVNEYLKNNTNEKLGDVVEVILALLKFEGSNLGELIEIMDDKREKKGGYEKKFFLKEVE